MSDRSADDNYKIGGTEVLESWREYIRDFRERVWPMLQEEGFTNFDLAFTSWMVNRMNNSIDGFTESLREYVNKRDPDDDEDDWKKE